MRNLKEIFVDQKYADDLEAAGIPFDYSKYPGQLLLTSKEPELDLFRKLVAACIVPSRIEPKVNLVSLYLDLTNDGDKQ